jgi:hypothetical protein
MKNWTCRMALLGLSTFTTMQYASCQIRTINTYIINEILGCKCKKRFILEYAMNAQSGSTDRALLVL